MRCLVALLLVQALVASSATAALVHIHEYTGHEHADHHHGPAAHQHAHRHGAAGLDHYYDGPLPPASDLSIQAESCDPGDHAISAQISFGEVPHLHVPLAEAPCHSLATPILPFRGATGLTDLRVHGPPDQLTIPSRAPPLQPLT